MAALAAKPLLEAEGNDIELVPRHLHGEAGRGGITDRQPGTVIRNPVAVRHLDARGGAVPRKHDIMLEIHLRQVGKRAIGRLMAGQVIQLQLGKRVLHPGLAERLPAEHIDTALAEKRPHRHLDSAGVRPRDNGGDVIIGKLQHTVDARDTVLDA